MSQRPVLTQRNLPPWLPAVLAVAVIGLLIAVIGGVDLWPGGGDETAATSTTTSSTSTTTTIPPDPIDAAALMVEPLTTDVPSSYKVTYDVVQSDVAGTEEVTVVRPYQSLSVSHDQAGALTTGDATSTTQLYFYLSDQESWLPLQGEKHRAEADTRPLAGMATLIELGLVTETGTATFAGRECTTYVTASSITSPVRPASDDETTELCIDADGLVLHERWQQAGSVLLERTATSVEVEPAVEPSVFDPTPLVEDVEQFEGALAEAMPASEEQLASLQTDIVAPEGYEADGAVVRTGAGSSQVVRFYTDGLNLVEHIEFEGIPDEDLGLGGAHPVEIEGVGEAWFVPGFSASTLRMRIGETGTVELTGPYPHQLVELLQSLTFRS